ncbi:hypothetical protein BYT27DRAFT_7312447 [Phlegmacium glaucopus]|nr:hypothetical protein BYT27DRAFT_7312447 [Phlegmacium glaucopus]
MLSEFSLCYRNKTGRRFNKRKRHIRCLAHIINLATQALISTKSQSKYYNSNFDDEHVPEDNTTSCDEVGLIRAIIVKARSSAQRKQLFKEIQERKGVKPVQLLLDMKVCWSSMYVMLNRADSRQEQINTFIYDLGLKEENLEKLKKVDALKLSGEEWE